MGIHSMLPNAKGCKVTYLEGDGNLGKSFEAVRWHIRASKSQRILVGAVNDPSALGALRAFQEAGRSDHCAVMGQNASPEARSELREEGTRLIGSVGYFPERYGDDLIRLSMDILNQRQVPPAVFVQHKLVTARTVDHYYPNDGLQKMVTSPSPIAVHAHP
jgi:ribose transport system substrate-binding protein